MLHVITHDQVQELVFSTAWSRALGYKVSAFVHRGMLIDTGFPRARGDLDRWLVANRLAGTIITHYHEDHAGNLDLVVERGIPAAVGPETLRQLPHTTALPLYRRLTWGNTTLPGRFESVEHPFTLVPTPGHTPDHLVVFDPDHAVVFSGDLFLGVKACLVHPYENPYQILESVRRVRRLEPRVLYDAHRGIVMNPGGLLEAKAAWLATAIGEIERRIMRGDPDRVIQARVLGKEGLTALGSAGEMSKLNFVRAIRRAGPRG